MESLPKEFEVKGKVFSSVGFVDSSDDQSLADQTCPRERHLMMVVAQPESVLRH